LAAGLANLAASEVNATMTVSGSYAGSAQLTQSTAMASTFNGTSALAQTTAISGTGASGLQTVALSYSFEPYETSDYATLGSATDSNGVQEYLVPDSPIVFPATVKVGDSAALGSMSAYLDSALKQLAAYIDVSYMVTADPGNNDAVIVEVIYQYYGPLSDPGVASQFRQLNSTMCLRPRGECCCNPSRSMFPRLTILDHIHSCLPSSECTDAWGQNLEESLNGSDIQPSRRTAKNRSVTSN
jgi:hypothetical protein